MSDGFYGDLADFWQKSKIDGLGMANPQEWAEEVMKNDSRAVESVAKKWNLPWLEQEAHGNVNDPARGIAKASVATGAGYLGANAGQWLGSSGLLSNGGGYVDQIGNATEGALQGSRTTGLLGNNAGAAAKRMAFRQGMDMMQPQQPQQAPMQRFQQPQQQTPLPYGQLTEEQKELLRQQGYLIY